MAFSIDLLSLKQTGAPGPPKWYLDVLGEPVSQRTSLELGECQRAAVIQSVDTKDFLGTGTMVAVLKWAGTVSCEKDM